MRCKPWHCSRDVNMVPRHSKPLCLLPLHPSGALLPAVPLCPLSSSPLSLGMLLKCHFNGETGLQKLTEMFGSRTGFTDPSFELLTHLWLGFRHFPVLHKRCSAWPGAWEPVWVPCFPHTSVTWSPGMGQHRTFAPHARSRQRPWPGPPSVVSLVGISSPPRPTPRCVWGWQTALVEKGAASTHGGKPTRGGFTSVVEWWSEVLAVSCYLSPKIPGFKVCYSCHLEWLFGK